MPQGMEAAGCSDMLKGTVKAMCSSGRSGSSVGEGRCASKATTGAVGESTQSKGAVARTVATRVAWNWLAA